MTSKTVILISNGSNAVYPNNTLSKFKNKLPEIIELEEKEKWVVAVESIGFSCMFRNIKLPNKQVFPSFMISNCARRPSLGTKIYFKFADNEDGKDCKWNFFHFQDKFYSENQLVDFFKDVSKKTNTNIAFHDDKLVFSIDIKTGWNPFWLLLHPTMMDTFAIDKYVVQRFEWQHNVSDDLNLIRRRGIPIEDEDKLNEKYLQVLDEKLVYYKGEKYFAYFVMGQTTIVGGENCNFAQRSYPNLVKIVCDQIEPQVLNSTFSKDLVCFCPDFDKEEDYYFREFETKQYIPLSNSSITDFKIKLLDANNSQLQLVTGTPTILKIHMKKMPKNKESFNVRLTSTVSALFPNNENYKFKVKLPNTLSLNKPWKVALTSINHPNFFKTFMPLENMRSISIKKISGPQIFNLIFANETYTQTSLITELNNFFTTNLIGSVEVVDNRVSLKFDQECYMVISNNVLRILGYTDTIDLSRNATVFPIIETNQVLRKIGEQFVITCSNVININYMKPNYIIAYTNFVNSTIIGGIYSKILRIIPIKHHEEGYVISEFKHKEFLDLQNTEINEIEIELRSHDGEYIYFGNDQNVILNLEFSNYLE
jgi:hypothetical protein